METEFHRYSNVVFSTSENDEESRCLRAGVLFDGEPATTSIKLKPLKHALGAFANLGRQTPSPPLRPFDLDPAKFIRRAEAERPSEPAATASAFSQWVYSLYGSKVGDDDDRKTGVEVEQAVWDRRIEVALSNDSAFLERHRPDWILEHCGLHVDDASMGFYEVPELTVAGKPLRCSPDMLYLNIRTMKYVIVEVKYSRMVVPTNLWPNVWAQLWCYSQIPAVSRSLGVTVIGEVWSDTESGIIPDVFSHRSIPNLNSKKRRITLRASVRRDPRKPAFDRFFRRLFDIYRGVE